MGRPADGFNQSTADNADALWDLLWENGRIGVTKTEACQELDITESQFGSAMRFIRHLLQIDEEQPVTYNPSTHRYVVNANEREAREYGRWILKRLQGQTESQKRFIRAVEAKFGNTRRVRRMKRHNEELVDTLEEMLEGAA